MRILVTNDDGVYSPGLAALAQTAAEFGEVRIVAPDVEQSSMGHAVTASRPLQYRPVTIGSTTAFRVNGTPADCVALGTHHWEGVDLVFSGINLGLNLGNAMWHSGTLAAAKQAALFGIRGVAFSAPVEAGTDYDGLRPCLRQVIALLLREPSLQLVNVNFPARPGAPRWTRQSCRHYDGKVVPDSDPYGRPHFWFVAEPTHSVEEGTDRWAVEHGWVSLTPLRLDLTDHEALARVAAKDLDAAR
jgi:5'-nucleotidase